MSVDVPSFAVGLACGLWSLMLLAALGRGGPRLWSGLVGLGGAAALAGGALALVTAPQTLGLPWPLAFGSTWFALRLDPLAGWFVAVIGLITVACSLYLPGYLAHLGEHADGRLLWPALGLLTASMVAVVLAANAPTFMIAWEVMSLSSFALVATDPRRPANRQAALVYLGATRLGTAFLVGGFLWAHALTGSWTFADWHLTGTAALGPGLLVLIGLGVKAGLWPCHLWLPIAHPAAPSPVSALMSGVMVKVAVYAMVRLLVLQPAMAHPALGVVLLGLGTVSAFWGVLFALLQHDLKRLLAYHTVENVGLIVMGAGTALVAGDLGLPLVARLALAAGLWHVLNHAVFKSLLFLGAGAVDAACGTRDLERLGGLGQRMPITGACFVLASAAICALPPLNGFASEWLLYQSLVHLAAEAAPPVVRFGAMLLLGWIALIGAMALACFVKATGVAFCGRPRTPVAATAHEGTSGMSAAQVLLAVACVLLGVAAPAVLSLLHQVTAPLAPDAPALAAAWTLPTGPLLVVLGLTVAAGAAWLQSGARRGQVATYITWECGFGDLGPRMQTTASSFAQPLLRLFGVLLRYAVERRLEGDRGELFPRRIHVEPTSEAVLEQRVYRPLAAWVTWIGGRVARLQTGSIHAYLLTMLLALLGLLLLGRMAP